MFAQKETEEKRRQAIRKAYHPEGLEPEEEEVLIAPSFLEIGMEFERIRLESWKLTLKELNINDPELEKAAGPDASISEARKFAFTLFDHPEVSAIYHKHNHRLVVESEILQRDEKVKKLRRYG
jgi:hypothetical protein